MGLIDNQKLQKGVATLLGVADESDQATKIARQWAEDNEYSDSEEDTLRHVLLGGFMQSVQGEGFGRMGKEIAGKLINKRESTDKESLIDVANNNFGRQLRKELINKDKDNSVEGFVEAAKNFVHNLRTEKEVRDVDGLRPKMSTAGQEKQIDMAKGGVVLMNKQMELFAGGGLKDEGGSVDEVSGNDVPVGSLKEEVRDDIPAKLSEGEFVLPADVVRFYGLAHIMKMRDVAKAGLAKMDSMGQMGNSDEATMEDDMPFSMEDLEVEDEEGNSMAYADGGYVRNFEVGGYNPATGTTTTGNTGISYTPASSFGTPVAPVAPVNVPQYTAQPAPQNGFAYKVPEGFAPQQLPAYTSVLGGTDGLPPSTKTKTYVNAAGHTIEIPLDGYGKPLQDIPAGYTELAGSAPAAPSAPSTQVVQAPAAPKQNDNNDSPKDTTPKVKAIDWMNLGTTELLGYANEVNSKASKMAMGVISSIPVVGSFAMLANAHQKGKIKDALQNKLLDPKISKTDRTLVETALKENQSWWSKNILKADPLELDKDGEYQPPKEVVKDSAKVTAVKDAANAAAAAHGNQAAIQESRDSGYTGSTVDGIVNTTGRVSDGNSRGVLGGADGKVVKVESSNKTVFVGSDGQAYTSGIFGSNKQKVEVVDGKYVETGKLDTSKGGGDAQSKDKIVCTAMNESYGFGGFRNLVWLAYARKNLTKEHEVGYHTIFLPLVDIAYKKNNKFVRVILEHIARHRTADLRAEMNRGKRDKLGRFYRFFLEPLCYIVGKVKMAMEK